MRVVVDEYPTGCKECVFAGEDDFWGYCVLSKWSIYNDEDEMISSHREEHCPIVEFSELLYPEVIK